MLCELHAGTILGALKFNYDLPWEVDADIHIEPSNYSTYVQIALPKLKKQGYRPVRLPSHLFI